MHKQLVKAKDKKEQRLVAFSWIRFINICTKMSTQIVRNHCNIGAKILFMKMKQKVKKEISRTFSKTLCALYEVTISNQTC